MYTRGLRRNDANSHGLGDGPSVDGSPQSRGHNLLTRASGGGPHRKSNVISRQGDNKRFFSMPKDSRQRGKKESKNAN